MFPLSWLLGFVAVLLLYLLAGSMVMNMANEYYDVPDGAGQIGLVGAFFASLFTGLIYAIFATLFSVIGAFGYNFLTRLGGGVAITLLPADEPSVGDAPEGSDELAQSVAMIPQAVPEEGTLRETEEDSQPNKESGEVAG